MRALLFAVLFVPLVLGVPAPPSGLMRVNYDYIVQAGLPLAGFRVPSGETNELVFTGQYAFTMSAAGMKIESPVGCTNVTDFWWLTELNKTYKVMVLTNNQWEYTRIKVIGDGKEFHFYDFSDFANKFYLK